MRYQVVVLASEIGDAMEIESFSWRRFPSPEDQGTFNDLKVYLGLCNSDTITTTFNDNFMPGTRTLVLSGSPYTTPVVPVGGWFDVVLDTPYWYNGQDNLLIEVEWSSGAGSLYSWSWNGTGTRSIFALYGQSTAAVSEPKVPNLRINGTLDLSQSTFGEIKASFN
jgi:hypothetical protein